MATQSSLTKSLIDLKLTGELNRNAPESNRQAIREMLARNTYWTFDGNGIIPLKHTYETAATIMAARLGITRERFESDLPPFIDPQKTTDGLVEAMEIAGALARDQGTIVFATAHPGSLLGFYVELAMALTQMGAVVVTPNQPIPAPDNRWIDSVAGVLVLSNEGDLNHTHNDMGMQAVLETLGPDLVIGDHSFVMAAINLGIKSIAIFDVDDPALAIMAEARSTKVHAIPMNDNQTNTRSAAGARALLRELSVNA